MSSGHEGNVNAWPRPKWPGRGFTSPLAGEVGAAAGLRRVGGRRWHHPPALLPPLRVGARRLATCARALPGVGSKDQLQRVADDAETVADLLFEISAVGEVEAPRVVDEQNDRWGFYAGLRCVCLLY